MEELYKDILQKKIEELNRINNKKNKQFIINFSDYVNDDFIYCDIRYIDKKNNDKILSIRCINDYKQCYYYLQGLFDAMMKIL